MLYIFMLRFIILATKHEARRLYSEHVRVGGLGRCSRATQAGGLEAVHGASQQRLDGAVVHCVVDAITQVVLEVQHLQAREFGSTRAVIAKERL